MKKEKEMKTWTQTRKETGKTRGKGGIRDEIEEEEETRTKRKKGKREKEGNDQHFFGFVEK